MDVTLERVKKEVERIERDGVHTIFTIFVSTHT